MGGGEVLDLEPRKGKKMICNSCLIRGNRLCLHLTEGEKANAKKAKKATKEVALVDSDGQEWAVASLTATRLNALLREYKRQGIFLTPKERVNA